MKTYQVSQPGGLDNLTITEQDIPKPRPGEVLVRWRASSLNFHDYLVGVGGIPVENGRVPMSDGAGEVVAVGNEVRNWKQGDKVMSLFFPNWINGKPTPLNQGMSGDTMDGYAREYSCINANSLTRMPSNYTFEQAATLPCAALTAWRALMVEGNLQAGESVLIQGTGGMSIFALQIAKAAGAYVYATSSSEDKMKRLKELGADEVFNYRTDAEWGKTIAKRSGGIDHVLDVGASATLAHSIDAVAIGGHLALIGVLGSTSAEIDMVSLILRHIKVTGLAVGSREMQEKMVAAFEVNDIHPIIDKSFGFDELKQAFEYQASGSHFGKIVVNFED
ncbi:MULTISPECIES: zinc-dependent alcohol dehydrogenase family protein [unclassified Agarivorans]|uniref:zinc-dependent alcohol dehydrogenase family protein n=1 Tax=unclassified Agarivorans TaxID=2636026 RepID=UPI0026E47018|nr:MULTISPECIES: NAD(P)-dependent alcohol dehydrogenase [unclassified Agarivorans]MDO6687038.1 NAD(P)-dependent alcohol dehydrogenase [Agarivorans sp. 3_MG-2023]MDO6713550.1 NAD(P)-dependent alcohol dehydrogenase [Agarivorans sp. 2_MG-2023]